MIMTYKGATFDLVCKSDDWAMRLLGHIFGAMFMNNFWTTYRLPFMKHAKICYALGEKSAITRTDLLDHEIHHVAQFAPWYGPLWMLPLYALLPLPMYFSGRWFIERHAYLDDIKAGRRNLEDVVQLLWWGYGLAWPRWLMRRWFQKSLRGG